MICPYCGYTWDQRVEKPKRCPKCQKWLPEPRYKMRFVPYDAEGKLKKSVPRPGVKGGIDDGDIVMLPLDQRWETWWELVDDEVPEDELAKDQKLRDEFMVKARIAEAERAKRLLPVGVPIT